DSASLALDITNLTDLPQTLKVDLTAKGLIGLSGAATQNVTLAKGERTTLQVPVTAKTGFGDGEVQVQISGLNLPGETVRPSQQTWKIGVRPPYPAQTLNFAAVIDHDRPWQVTAAAFAGL
ncbi:hypothetical protein, partial [Pantoea ananatis]